MLKGFPVVIVVSSLARKWLHKCKIIVAVQQIPSETTECEGETIKSKSVVRLANVLFPVH